MSAVVSLIYLVSLSSMLYYSTGQSYSDTQNLHRTLMANYSKDIMPVLNQSDPVNLVLTLTLKSLNVFEEIEGRLCVFAALTTTWTDEMLIWTPSDYGNVTEFTVPEDRTWRPYVYISNALNVAMPTSKTTISHGYNGQAMHKLLTSIETVCTPEITFYPNDLHTCAIELTSLSPKIGFTSSSINTRRYQINAEWNLLRTWATIEQRADIEVAVFYITFERRITFLMLNVVPPILFIGFVNPLVFFLPADSGERVSFATTVLLSFAVFSTLIADRMPPTSNTVSVLCVYLLLMLLFSSAIAMVTVFTLSVYHADDRKSLPKSARKLVRFVDKVNAIFKTPWRKNMIEDINDNDRENVKQDFQSDEKKIPSDITEDNDAHIDNTSDWKRFANVLDSVLFTVFFSSMMLITITAMIVIFCRPGQSFDF